MDASRTIRDEIKRRGRFGYYLAIAGGLGLGAVATIAKGNHRMTPSEGAIFLGSCRLSRSHRNRSSSVSAHEVPEVQHLPRRFRRSGLVHEDGLRNQVLPFLRS